MDDLVSRLVRELPDTNRDRYDIAYERGRHQARSSLFGGGLIAGLAGGLVAMFLLDPERGRSRRAELGQRLAALGRDLGRGAGRRGHDLRQRATGAAHELGLPGTPPTNEARRAERRPSIAPRSVSAELRRTDERAGSDDDATARVPVGAGAGTPGTAGARGKTGRTGASGRTAGTREPSRGRLPL